LVSKKFSTEMELQLWLSQSDNIIIAGIGNTIRSDDFVGVKIIQELRGNVPSRVHLIECETVPESFMDEIVELKPSHVLLIDAALLGLKPGDVRLFDISKVKIFPSISTHMLPVRVFCEYIAQLTKAKIAFLLIEPYCTEFGEGLTPKVASAAKMVVKTLLGAL
jgi:hydrogenase 3 maturation protease